MMAVVEIEHRTYTKGQYVFRERETGDLAFIVKNGSVNVTKIVDDSEKVIATLAKGAMFGEMALIDNKPRMASAKSAEEGTVLIVVSRELFDEKLRKTDPFIRGVLNILSEQVRSLSNKEPPDQEPQKEGAGEG